MFEWLRSCLWRACAMALALFTLAAAPVRAGDIEFFTPETLSASADLRLTATDGDPSWNLGDFGKLRYGDSVRPRIGNADLVWQPRLGWLLSATVTASYLGGPRSEAGISEAFFTLRPRFAGTARGWARVGLMWVPSSLEHSGADWHVTDTITPSAINSWISEEVRPLTAEVNAQFDVLGSRITATGAVFTANDTAGTLLTLRGWALNDRKTLIDRRQPLPSLPAGLVGHQPLYTHPTIIFGNALSIHPGFYLKLAWLPSSTVRVEAFHYDNNANPVEANANNEYGWRTRFDQIAAEIRLSDSTRLKGQIMSGSTRMGMTDAVGRIWVENHFRSAFGLLTHSFGATGAALRGEAFSTRQLGTLVTSADNETGWAATFAAHRTLDRSFSLWLEALHIDSTREARLRAGRAPQQRQNQLQLVLRGIW